MHLIQLPKLSVKRPHHCALNLNSIRPTLTPVQEVTWFQGVCSKLVDTIGCSFGVTRSDDLTRKIIK